MDEERKDSIDKMGEKKIEPAESMEIIEGIDMEQKLENEEEQEEEQEMVHETEHEEEQEMEFEVYEVEQEDELEMEQEEEQDMGLETKLETEHKEDEESFEENIKSIQDVHPGEDKKAKSKKPRRRILSYIAVAIVASLIGGAISPFAVLRYMEKNNMLSNKEDNVTYSIADVLDSGEKIDAIAVVAQNAMRNVVGITTKSVQQFGPFQQEVSGVGSGVIVDSNGYILTNAHVINGGNANDIKVLFENGNEKKAEVLWYDTLLDMAIIKVDATGLPVAKLGDSDKLLVGQTAIAIGNPLGLEFQSTVTAGIISGLHRSINVEGNVIEDLIQTDASINQGNSGGPLLNSKGEVVGINTAKITSAEGLGFAIPINSIKPVIEQVIESGTYKTVLLGIKGIEVEIYERQLGIDISADKGVIILEVAQGTPAYNAGLRVGDVITKIDNNSVESMSQLKKALYNYKQGDKAQLTIIRNGVEDTLEIVFTQVK